MYGGHGRGNWHKDNWNKVVRYKGGQRGQQQRHKRPYIVCQVCLDKGEKQAWSWTDRAEECCRKCQTPWNGKACAPQPRRDGGNVDFVDGSGPSSRPGAADKSQDKLFKLLLSDEWIDKIDKRSGKKFGRDDFKKEIEKLHEQASGGAAAAEESPISEDKLLVAARRNSLAAIKEYNAQESKCQDLQKQRKELQEKLKVLDEKVIKEDGKLLELDKKKKAALQAHQDAKDTLKRKEVVEAFASSARVPAEASTRGRTAGRARSASPLGDRSRQTNRSRSRGKRNSNDGDELYFDMEVDGVYLEKEQKEKMEELRKQHNEGRKLMQEISDAAKAAKRAKTEENARNDGQEVKKVDAKSVDDIEKDVDKLKEAAAEAAEAAASAAAKAKAAQEAVETANVARRL